MNKTSNFATVNDGVLKINLSIDDPRIVSHFAPIEAAGNDLTAVISDYLRLYIAILDAASPRHVELSVTQSIDGLGEMIGNAMADFDNLLKESLGEQGHTAQAIAQFQAKLLDYAGSKSSPFHMLIGSVLEKIVKQEMEKFQMTSEGVAEAVLAISEPKLTENHKEVMESVRRLESEISSGKKIAEVIESTPKKGAPYEEVAYDALSKIASEASDLCEDTKNKNGEIGRKSGDFVVTHTIDGSPRFNIVYEAKSGPMTSSKWIDEADLALPNRSASVFVGLAKDRSGVPGKEGFIMLRENVLILHFDPENSATDENILKVVYRYALTIGRSKFSGKTSGLSEAAEELKLAISDLKSRHSQAKKVEENGKALKEFVEDLSKSLPKILGLITASEDDS